MSKIEVNTVDVQCGSTLTLGSSGKTVTLATGASQSGFGRSGSVNWCTTAKTSPFSAVSGNGYFINTTGGTITVTLPSGPSAGDIVAFTDYAGTFDCNAVTLCRNSSKIKGGCSNLDLKDERESTTIVYVDGTQGWVAVSDTNVCGAALKPQDYTVQYLVVAGGGGGGSVYGAGGGGAGGYRTIACKSFTVNKGTTYPITIGAGGAAGDYSQTPRGNYGSNGANSVFSTITSTGGGGGGGGYAITCRADGKNGGSGGGGGSYDNPGTAGSGNTPPVSPSQGNPGGTGPGVTPANPMRGGGGGGANAAGAAGSTGSGGDGGNGTATSISGASVTYAGGGGGSAYTNPGGTPAGSGGGGAGGSDDPDIDGVAGTANTGGGGGAGASPAPGPSDAGAGGSGIVIIRRLTASSCSSSGTVSTCGSDTIHKFTATGTFVA